jgi:glycosyltransferase involved in cell wall biosynthesis
VAGVSGIGEPGTTRHVVLPYGPENPSVRTRALHWIERLQASGRVAEGSVVVHGPGWRTGAVPRGSDVLLLRNIGRLTRGGRERRLLERAGLAVYDLDDGLPWDDGNLPGLGRWWKRPFPRSLVAERAARAADRMIVGNDVLAEWAAARCHDVRIVPTCIEPGDYRRRTTWELGDTPVIGWIGSPATEPYLADIADALAAVHRRTGARLHVISGGGPPHPRLAPFTTASRWSTASTAEVAGWDVGLMPLRDGVYERAKCGYKLLQYAASAVPAVGSPVGVNATLLTAMDGLAATSGTEWTDALTALLTEPAARRAARAAAALSVAEAYSYVTWQDAWVDAVGW